MTKVSLLLLLLPVTSAFSPAPLKVTSTALYSTSHPDCKNPSWQDIWDDDCSMDSTYAASFIPSEWLKKLPCMMGLKVSSE